MKAKPDLYQVTFKVRPTFAHSMYNEIGTSLFHAWVFAESVQDAGDRAMAIIKQALYEIVSDEFAAHRIENPTPAQEAKALGFSFFVQACRKGEDYGLDEVPFG